MKPKQQGARGPTQRQLMVGEELRHALSSVFQRGEARIPELADISITVSEVRISPDLKNATAYVMPLAGERAEEVIKLLNEAAGGLRHMMSKRVALKFSPKLHFKLDRSFEEASRINQLLSTPKVRRDTHPEAEGDVSEDDQS